MHPVNLVDFSVSNETMNILNQFNIVRRQFLHGVIAIAAGAAFGRHTKFPGPEVWFTEMSAARHLKFQPTAINVCGSDNQGNLLPEFNAQMVARAIARQIDQIVDPSSIRGLEDIPGCGMYCLWIRNGAQCQRYRFWILWENSE